MYREPCPYCGIDAGTGPNAHAKPQLCIAALKSKISLLEQKIEAIGEHSNLNWKRVSDLEKSKARRKRPNDKAEPLPPDGERGRH
jgi:hypothetical protein